MSAASINSHEIVHNVNESTKEKDDSILITALDSNSSAESDLLAKNPFLDPKVEEYYRQVYTECNYESYSAFDPTFTWTPEEETKLVRKLNFRVAAAACIMFVGLQVDRGNLSQAVTDNMLGDLNMNTNDYNTGNTIFLVCFLLAEVPSQLISKALGPDIFIPIQICLWSIVAMSQAALSGRTSFFVTRALIGALEGGFIADLVLWLSYFFTSKELPVRLSWFWVTLSLVGVFTSLLAFGLLRMRGIAGWGGWRWLFLIEGIVTLLIGIGSFYMMVPSAVQTKNWLRPKGWFTEREEKIVVNRVLRDDPSKGTMHNRQGLTPKMLFKSLIDFDIWPIYAIGLLAYIGQNTFSSYFGLINKSLGFSTFNTNLLAIPYQVVHIIFLLLITWFSERVNERSLVCTLAPLYATPLIAIIRWWPQAGKNVWGTWTLNTLFLGQPYIHAICVAWVSRNSNSVRTRSVSSAIYNMFVQLGNVAANNIYRKDDLPLYHRGNMQLFAITFALIPLMFLVKYYYIVRNKHKTKLWDAMTPDEQEYYRKNTTDEGARRLDFTFVH
ncbi:putative transporter [Spathaspora sp. JA1]|nr:putative transporter [Spathaspora sp. JA1]